MTHTDYTKLMLNIEDKNIYFNENCLEINHYLHKWLLCSIIYL